MNQVEDCDLWNRRGTRCPVRAPVFPGEKSLNNIHVLFFERSVFFKPPPQHTQIEKIEQQQTGKKAIGVDSVCKYKSGEGDCGKEEQQGFLTPRKLLIRSALLSGSLEERGPGGHVGVCRQACPCCLPIR